MNRASVLAVVALAVAAASCRGAASPSTGDVFEANDFLVGDDALRDKPVEVPLGSMKRASEGGAFYAIGDAVELFTRYAWRTRPASPSDLVPGVHAACFLSRASSVASCGAELQRAPRTRAEGFTRQWVVAPLKDAPQGNVVVVAGCRCEASGVRVVVP